MSSAVRILFERRRTEEEAGREFRPLSRGGASTKNGRVYPDVAWKSGAQAPAKPRYKVDLQGQQADCEANYLRLRKLLPELAERDQWLFEIGSGPTQGRMAVTVLDRAPYTTTLEISEPPAPESRQAGSPAPLKAPRLTVCLYHDADMAEVVAWENHGRLRARYDYPNRQMYQCDEKSQLNRFLADWLTLCQAQGRTAFDLADMGLYK